MHSIPKNSIHKQCESVENQYKFSISLSLSLSLSFIFDFFFLPLFHKRKTCFVFAAACVCNHGFSIPTHWQVSKGYEFESDTDTEVIPKLIKYLYDNRENDYVSFSTLVERVIQQLVSITSVYVCVCVCVCLGWGGGLTHASGNPLLGLWKWKASSALLKTRKRSSEVLLCLKGSYMFFHHYNICSQIRTDKSSKAWIRKHFVSILISNKLIMQSKFGLFHCQLYNL